MGYWDSNNIVGNSINAVRITALDSYFDPDLTAVGIVNGEVYLAGYVGLYDLYNNYDRDMPYYYRLATGGYSVMNASLFKHDNYVILSIIDQNGSPVFYGETHNSALFYCDTGWNITVVREYTFPFRTNRIVYSDGDVYVPFRRSTYMVLREPFPTRSVGLVVGVGPNAENPVSQWHKGGYITGLVVR